MRMVNLSMSASMQWMDP